MKKKLAIITTHPIQYYAPLFRELAKSNKIELKVFYTKGKPQEQQFEPDFGKSITWDIPLLDGYSYSFVKNLSKKKNGFFSISNPDLISEVVAWQAEAILIFGWSYQSHLAALRYFKGKIPVYFRGDSTLLDEDKSVKNLLRRIFLSWVYSHVDKAIYVGEANKQYFLKHGLASDKLIFAPHAIDNQRFIDIDNAFANKALEWRKNLGIAQNDKTVLFVGKFIAKKNPLLLLDTFSSLALPNVHLIFVGNGELETQMRLMGGRNKNIHFIPFQNQSSMPVVYRLGDIFCLPSKGPGETWGLAVNEAMVSGCAVLVSNKCGCALDLVKNGSNGFVFESDNKEMLASCLNKMLNQDLVEFKKASIEIIHNYTFIEITKAIESILSN